MRRTSLALLGASLGLLALGATAQTFGFLKDSAMSFMNREDAAMLVRNYQEALGSLPDGHTSTWTNPKTGHSGTATPLNTTRQKGMTCRLLEITNRAGGQSGRGEYTFCKTAAGWKILS